MKPDTDDNRLRISLAELRPVVEAAMRAGSNIADALAASGLDADLLESPDSTPVDLSAYFRFSEYAGRAAQDETIGVSRRSLLPGSTHFALSHLPEHSTLLDAMREIAKSYNFLHGGSFNHVELHDDRLNYIIDDSRFPYAPGTDEAFRRFTMECVMIFLHSILVSITSDILDSKLLKLHLTRKRKPGIGTHLDFWNAPFRFSASRYALIYDPSAAELPILMTAENMPSSRGGFGKVAELIERREARLKRAESIAARVGSILEGGTTSQPAVARKLALSVASLRRRLDDEGTSFRDLCKAKMNDQAKLLLKRGLSIPEVAASLGFSDFRSFTRAFKGWNDMTPSAYLQSLDAAALAAGSRHCGSGHGF